MLYAESAVMSVVFWSAPEVPAFPTVMPVATEFTVNLDKVTARSNELEA